MTSSQLGKYRKEWGMVRRVLRAAGLTPDQADAERHALHIKALGFDKSSTLLSNDEFDEVLKVFRAISQPANARTQIALEEMPETRKRTYIRQVLAALGEGEGYVETIITSMQRSRKWKSTGAGSFLTLDTLKKDGLKDVLIALKIECRRRWDTKDHLLGEIHTLRMDNDYPELETSAAIMQELCITTLPPLAKLVYEDLLVVFGTLRRLADGTLAFPVIASRVEQPF